MSWKLAIVPLGMAIFTPLARPQMRVAGLAQPAGRGGVVPVISRRGALGLQRSRMERAERFPLLLGGSYFYGDDFPAAAATETAAPQVVIVQPAPAAEVAKAPRAESLLIEWQGDHYARISASEGTAHGVQAAADYAEAKPAVRTVERNATPSPVALEPAVLVYRDGHREDIRDYTIADGVLYARGDYWTDGFWNKKIQLSALNVPASMKASAEHGVKFVLPASPNEVITRP